MPKSTVTYWNPLLPENGGIWQPISGLEGMAEELTLSLDEATGEYTRLTRFHSGADTRAFGGKRHAYPEEIFILKRAVSRATQGQVTSTAAAIRVRGGI